MSISAPRQPTSKRESPVSRERTANSRIKLPAPAAPMMSAFYTKIAAVSQVS